MLDHTKVTVYDGATVNLSAPVTIIFKKGIKITIGPGDIKIRKGASILLPSGTKITFKENTTITVQDDLIVEIDT